MRMCILFYRNLLLKHYHCLRWMHNKNRFCLGNSRGRQWWRLRMRVKVIAVSPVPSTLLFFVDGNGAEESKGRGSWVTRRGALLLLGNPPVADHCCLGQSNEMMEGKEGKNNCDGLPLALSPPPPSQSVLPFFLFIDSQGCDKLTNNSLFIPYFPEAKRACDNRKALQTQMEHPPQSNIKSAASKQPDRRRSSNGNLGIWRALEERRHRICQFRQRSVEQDV